MLTEEREAAPIAEARVVLQRLVEHFDLWPKSPYDTEALMESARRWLELYPPPDAPHVDHRD